mmetsp:Transcript_26095/g.30306  ORF Transcript_26095/g.30306 Transcript_26095/m.30306 type:complete len:302 (+) Transcript_26095:158-1063(+)
MSSSMMEVDTPTRTTATTAGAAVSSQIKIHPLAIIGISDHQTRITTGGSPLSSSTSTSTSTSTTTTSRMEIEDILPKPPMIVIDGPNVAHAYGQALGDLRTTKLNSNSNSSYEPDAKGILIAASYFLNTGCRVQIVIPTYWLQRKEQMEILEQLKYQNLLLCSPPTDDDDAYVIAVARREDVRSKARNSSHQQSTLELHSNHTIATSCDVMSVSGAFILSNDLFRDAMARDISGDLKHWLQGSGSGGQKSSSSSLRGRISYSFCDMGSIDKYGDVELDFIANPRHALVGIIERSNRKHGLS